MRNRLEVLQTVYRVSNDPADLVRLKTFKDTYLRRIRETKREKYGSFISNSGNVIKSAWQLINFERNQLRRVDSCSINCNEFNDAFVDQVDEIMSGFSAVTKSASDCFGKKLLSAGSFFFEPILDTDVLRAIYSQKNSSAFDCYFLNIKILRGVADIMAPVLTILFNRCVSEGVFPGVLKVARVVPVFKKGDRSCPRNYRPIAITPLFGRIFECLIKERLSRFFEDRELFSSAQFGFRASRSTGDAVGRFVGGVVEGFERGSLSAALLFDLRKAFDCVSHGILLEKLERYGVRGPPLTLLASYLFDRKQFVNLGAENSSIKHIKYGVPQGSVLGPLLFTIYINDLPDFVKAGSMTLFADDTTVLIAGENADELGLCARSTEDEIKSWFSANRLLINSEKTQTVTFSLNPRIYTGRSVRLLGVTVDDSLRWREHAAELCDALAKQIFVLRRLRGLVDGSMLLVAYHALFQSRLKYCISSWGHSAHVDAAFKMQKKALRVVCNKSARYSCRDLFRETGVLTLASEFILATLTSVRKNISDFLVHSDIHNYNTRHQADLVIPYSRLTAGKRTTINVSLFNKLPENVRQMNLLHFRQNLKRYLVANAFYTIDEFLSSPPWPV